MTVDDIEEAAKASSRECTGSGNTFQLKDAKTAFSNMKKKQAEKDGLDPDSVNATVCDKTAKIAMTAAAMRESCMRFSNKSLQKKTEARFVSEHSVMGAYAYATTVLSTHFVEGPRPQNLKKMKPALFSSATKETIDWVKTTYGTEWIYPVDPNLVLSTDDTTLFVFEGTTGHEEEWGWTPRQGMPLDRAAHGSPVDMIRSTPFVGPPEMSNV